MLRRSGRVSELTVRGRRRRSLLTGMLYNINHYTYLHTLMNGAHCVSDSYITSGRYREWIASRIKIKEDKKKKKGRLSELARDADVSLDSDKSLAETDISLTGG